jgi:hypothetical protein
MSYNILKSKVNFVGDDTPEIEGIVDTSTDQTVNGQKTFTDLSASNISIGERISHTGDSDTRIQFGTDNIAFMADGGTQILTVYGNLNPDRVQVNNGNLIVANDNLGVGVLIPSFKLQVDGNISGSGTFHNVGNATFGGNLSVTGTISGNGSGLTNLPIASNMLAESIIGQVSGSQISASNGLTTSGNNLVVQVSGTASGLVSETNGVKIDLTGLSTTSYSDADFILISASAGNRKMQLSTLESGFDSLAASQVTSGRFNTARMPLTIETQTISASVSISGALFQGDGRLLTGVTAAPSPAGSDTEIQFNDGGSLAGDPQLLFLKATNTLATTALSASGDLSGSSLRILDSIFTGGNTFLDSNGNIFTANISGSGTIHVVGSASFGNDLSITGAYFGDGRQLTGLPITNAASNAVVTVNNATTKTVDASSNFVYDGSDVIVTSGDVKATNLSASSDVLVGNALTASALHTNGGITVTSAGGDIAFLDTNGNVTAGAITMIDGSGPLNFGNNQISGSGHISGSALYFENSLNLGGQPIIDANGNASVGQLTAFVDSRGNTNLPTDNSRATFYVDEAANKFFVFVKYSDGTEKSGSIDLE